MAEKGLFLTRSFPVFIFKPSPSDNVRLFRYEALVDEFQTLSDLSYLKVQLKVHHATGHKVKSKLESFQEQCAEALEFVTESEEERQALLIQSQELEESNEALDQQLQAAHTELASVRAKLAELTQQLAAEEAERRQRAEEAERERIRLAEEVISFIILSSVCVIWITSISQLCV